MINFFQTLADLVSTDDLDLGRLYPHPKLISECSIKIATRIAEYAYETGVATLLPKPDNLEEYIRSQTYDTNYEPAIPPIYSFPATKL